MNPKYIFMKPKKILVLMDSLGVGGAEKQVISLVNNINKELYNITIGYLKNISDLYDEINSNNVDDIICYHRKNKIDLAVFNKIAVACKNNEFDIIMCTAPYPMLYAYLVKKIFKLKFKIFTVIHLTIPKPGIWMNIKYMFFKKIFNHCEQIVFVCENQMRYWISKYGVKPKLARFIYNGVDYKEFDEKLLERKKNDILNKYNILPGEIVIGNIAALRSEKKHVDILEAARKLRNSGYLIRVLIVGDGPCRHEINNFIIKCKMENYANLCGYQKDVKPYLATMDIKIISSDAVETFSIAALEAMCMAKPLILTDIGGASEMVEEGVNGYLYPPRDIESLASRIKTIIDTKMVRKMGLKSREIVTKKFTMMQMVSSYEKLFDMD